MRVLFLSLAALFLVVGCSKREDAIKIFSQDKPYVKALKRTKRGEIDISLEMKASIIATYLGDERFFVRVYIDNDFEDENRSGLFHPGYSLTLNSKAPIDIKPIHQDDSIVKRMPFVEPWYHLYIVTFPKVKGSLLKLEFANKEYGATALTFSKEY